ncbi:MAG: hypothetical protein ACJA1P_000736, partial [Maribacter sp.]
MGILKRSKRKKRVNFQFHIKLKNGTLQENISGNLFRT